MPASRVEWRPSLMTLAPQRASDRILREDAILTHPLLHINVHRTTSSNTLMLETARMQDAKPAVSLRKVKTVSVTLLSAH